jgi:hypothetical protein
VLWSTRELLAQLGQMRKAAAADPRPDSPVHVACRIAGTLPYTHFAGEAPQPPGLGHLPEWKILKLRMVGKTAWDVDLSHSYRVTASAGTAVALHLHSLELHLDYHIKALPMRHQIYQPKGNNWETFLEDVEGMIKCEKLRQFTLHNSVPSAERPPRHDGYRGTTTDDLANWLDTPVVARLLVLVLMLQLVLSAPCAFLNSIHSRPAQVWLKMSQQGGDDEDADDRPPSGKRHAKSKSSTWRGQPQWQGQPSWQPQPWQPSPPQPQWPSRPPWPPPQQQWPPGPQQHWLPQQAAWLPPQSQAQWLPPPQSQWPVPQEWLQWPPPQ